MDLVTVSVIIPTHRQDGALQTALESVFAQIVQPDEVIVVDDSADGLSGCADSPKHRIVRSQARSASGSRNLGVEHASSEFIAFLDDDDRWLPSHLEHFKESVPPGTPRDRVLFAGMASVFDASTGAQISQSAPRRLEGRPAIEIAKQNRITTSGVIASRSLLQRNTFDLDLARQQDRDLWVRLVADGAIVIGGALPTVDYFWEPRRVTARRVIQGNRAMASRLRTLGYSRPDVLKYEMYNYAAHGKRRFLRRVRLDNTQESCATADR